MKKKILITGIFGQDGSYLCELAAEFGYEIHGIVKKNLSNKSLKIKDYLIQKNIKFNLHNIDLNNYDKVPKYLLNEKIVVCESKYFGDLNDNG